MICPRCNSQNPSQAKFCQICGYFLFSNPPSFFTRHKGLLITILFFLFLVIPFLLLFNFFSSLNKEEIVKKEDVIAENGDNKIALINAYGIITDDNSPKGINAVSEGIVSEKSMSKVLKEIAADPKVKILLLKINSPGGSSAASEEIYQDLLNYKRKTGNKIVVYFSEVAASGAYYISMAADKIIANPSTITGSIGVIMSYINYGDLAEKYGVKNIVYKSGPHKDIISEFRPPTKEEDKIMQDIVDDSYEAFVNVVSKGRNLSGFEVKKIADGRVYSAKQAEKLGLIDSLGSFEDAIVLAKNLAGLKEASVIQFKEQTNFIDYLLGSISQRINLSLLPQTSALSYFKTSPRLLYLYNP